VLQIIAVYKRHYAATGNPAFVWAARQIRQYLPGPLPEEAYRLSLKWIDDYLDDVTARLTDLVRNPPPNDVNDRIAEALGFEAAPGPGRGSPLSGAQKVLRDGGLAAAVMARLPFERGKVMLAISHVAEKEKLSKTTVGDAYRSFKKSMAH
jgi:hypothetical protein